MKYKTKIERQYCRGDLRSAWGKSIASINQSSCEATKAIWVNGVDDDNLAYLIYFFSHFERSDFSVIKINNPKELSELRIVALTSLVMKVCKKY